MGRFTSGGVIYEELPDGNVRVVGYENQTIGPVDPSLQFEVPKASADARRAAADATVAEAEAPYAASIAQANAREAEAKASMAARDAERGRPSLEGSAYKDALGAYYAAQQLEGTISDIEMRFKEGPGRTGFPTGAVDWLPTAANQRFDKAASGARGPAIQALGFSATQMNTPAEAQLNIGAYIPSSGDWDSTIQDTIARLKDLQRTTMQRSVAVLGGVPDANGVIRPVTEVPPEQLPNALRQTRVTEGQDNQAAGFDADTRRQDLPPEYQAAHAAFIAANPNGIDPEAYVRFRSSLDEQFNQTPDPEAYRAWANEATQVLQQGGTINRTVPGPEVSMSTGEQIWNNLATNPVGAAVVGAADMGSFGGVSALAGDKVDALRDEQFLPMLAGEIGGAITGTGMLGKLGREVTKRALPPRQVVQVLRGGEGRGQFLRDLLTDATFGGIYGGLTQGDPLTGAASAGIGSGLGQGAGKTLGSIVGGVSQSAPVQTLIDRGVRGMTTGQRLGGLPKTIEDAMTSMPGVGSMVTARRMEGLEDFNRAAFREAGDPQAAAIGEQGIANLQDNVIPEAYNRALGGQQFVADDAFGEALRGRVGAAESLPPNMAAETRNALERSIRPFVGEAGEMSGQDFQRAYQNLQRRSSKFDNLPDPSGMDAAEVLRGSLDDLSGMVESQAPVVVPAFQDANTGYMRAKILEDAVARGINTEGMFTPAQLGLAARQSGKKFGGTQARPERQFFDLQRAGQDVLPSKLPDSGTPLRSILAGGGIAAGAGAGGAALGGTEGAGMGAGGVLTLGALLTILGTRRGQQALNAALFERAPGARKLGDSIDSYKGLAGSATIPLTMQDVR